MKEFKGSPGPWSVFDYEIFDGDGDHIIDMTYSSRTDVSEDKANAKLIAAAPSLLKELQKLREYVINVCGVDDEDCDSDHPLMSSRAAISKALGEE